MGEAFVCDPVRTPMGRFGGALASVRADDLAAIPISALMDRNRSADWSQLDDVVLGCANQAGEDNRNVARMALLLAGMPVQVPGTTVNRLCGSGMDAVGIAARSIRAGEAEFVVAGGVESMTRAPFVMPKAETAFARASAVHDTTIGWRFVNPRMKSAHGVDSMPETADNVARAFSIARDDQDAFALRSQKRWAAAQAAGVFRDEIVPVRIPQRKGEPLVVDSDEHPRPDTTLDQLGRLKGINGPELTVTAGNASGVNDGAAAMVVASEPAASRNGFIPLARVVGMAVAGVEPRIMGIGPVPAIRKVLSRTGLSLEQMDHVELNEAFAAQALAVTRTCGLDPSKINPLGGAIALGHPLGATGAIRTATIVHGLRRRKQKYGMVTMCIGTGMGAAGIFEAL